MRLTAFQDFKILLAFCSLQLKLPIGQMLRVNDKARAELITPVSTEALQGTSSHVSNFQVITSTSTSTWNFRCWILG